jgi:fatty-acyl-CoA synthase
VPVERVFVFSLAGETIDQYESYEDLINSGDANAQLHEAVETDPATLCFTGGTTGRPKGVVYSHRALMLHAFGEAMVDGFGYGRRDVVMLLVPMFHVNGWGVPYSASMVGATLVLPGIQPTPADVLDLCCEEKVSWTAGVPTVWADAFHEIKMNPGRWKIDHGLTIVVGGAAPHRTLFIAARDYGINLVQGWGMTESSGVVAACRPNRRIAALSPDDQLDTLVKQGVPVPVAQLRIVRDGVQQPWDGVSQGEIQIRGTSVTGRYFERPDAGDRWTADGWFRTGDIGTVDAEGYVHAHERSEDLIKSGGEWISPTSLENALLAHPSVFQCAVIGVLIGDGASGLAVVVACREAHRAKQICATV